MEMLSQNVIESLNAIQKYLGQKSYPVIVREVSSDPDGKIRAPFGMLGLDRTSTVTKVYINRNGQTEWSKLIDSVELASNIGKLKIFTEVMG